MPAYYGDFVNPTAFCAPSDVATFMGSPAPANINMLIGSATTLVLRATRQAYYVVDPTTGLATDTYIAAALKQATVVQVAAWITLGINPLAGGVLQPSVTQSDRLGPRAVTYADGKLAAQAMADSVYGLVPEAERILELANLLIPNPWTFG